MSVIVYGPDTLEPIQSEADAAAVFGATSDVVRFFRWHTQAHGHEVALYIYRESNTETEERVRRETRNEMLYDFRSLTVDRLLAEAAEERDSAEDGS